MIFKDVGNEMRVSVGNRANELDSVRRNTSEDVTSTLTLHYRDDLDVYISGMSTLHLHCNLNKTGFRITGIKEILYIFIFF